MKTKMCTIVAMAMHFKSSVYSASLTLRPVGGSQHSPALIADPDSEAARVLRRQWHNVAGYFAVAERM